jgi:hypothetical protein
MEICAFQLQRVLSEQNLNSGFLVFLLNQKSTGIGLCLFLFFIICIYFLS